MTNRSVASAEKMAKQEGIKCVAADWRALAASLVNGGQRVHWEGPA